MTSKGDVEYWRDGAACRNVDPEIFFPDGTAGPALLEIDRARALSRGARYGRGAYDWALRHGAAFGIWGGLTEDERRAVRRRALPLRTAQQAGKAHG